MQFSKDDAITYFRGSNDWKVTYKRDEKHKDATYPAVLEVDGNDAMKRLADFASALKVDMRLNEFVFSANPRDYSFTTTLASHPGNADMIHQGSNEPDQPWARIIFVSNAARDKFERMVTEKTKLSGIAIGE